MSKVGPALAPDSLLAVVCLVLTVGLVGCGGPPALVVPIQDPGPGSVPAETAHASIYARSSIAAHVDRAELGLRLGEARAVVERGYAGFAANDATTLAAAAAIAYRDGRIEDGLVFFESSLEAGGEAEVYALHAHALADAGRFELARGIAYDGLDQWDSADLVKAADRAFDEDPLLSAPIKTLEPDSDLEKLKALGGGSTVTLKAVRDGENVAAIKPDQDLGQSMYRSEIAYYRLCALLRCTFRVPYNGHVRISRRDFDKLYARVDSPKQRGYKSKFVHLRWKSEDGTEYLHATWKGWVPAFTGFPIEATAAWTKWLEAGSSRDPVSPAIEWLPTLAEYAGPRGWSRHKKRMELIGDLSMGVLMHQISDQISMDFLSNNWDRFSGDPELYGANCHLEPGGLVAIDNGASFPPWKTSRVARRLQLSQRFSRKLVASLRRLDHDQTLDRLFPGANLDETKRFEVFWERRTEYLEYVDSLVATHGADAIYLD